jgi:hypothetical protein
MTENQTDLLLSIIQRVAARQDELADRNAAQHADIIESNAAQHADIIERVSSLAAEREFNKGKDKGMASVVWSVGGFVASAVIALGTAYISRASP